MKKNDLLALRSKKPEELKKEISAKRIHLLKKNDKKIRREIAQILTVIKEKEILEKETKVQ